MSLPIIHWHGFIDEVLRPENAEKELAAFLFSEQPYTKSEQWHVLQVKNIGLKGDTFGGWAPDRNHMQRLKAYAKRQKWTKLGNIHTHPLSKKYADAGYADDIDTAQTPSETDLKFAAKFNDIVRGIIVVDWYSEPPRIPIIHFHDKYGRTIFTMGSSPSSLVLSERL